MNTPLHATAAALWVRGGWRAVLIGGPSGAGKSDLTLRMMGRGWRLVGDDYVHLIASGAALYVTGAPAISGRIEARGLGVIEAAPLPLARVVLWIAAAEGPVERLPEPDAVTVEGRSLPRLTLNLLTPSTVEVVAAAVRAL